MSLYRYVAISLFRYAVITLLRYFFITAFGPDVFRETFRSMLR